MAQVAAEIRGAIMRGDLRAGDRVPSEPQIMQDYALSKMSARRVIERLKTEGLVESRRGSGTYVRSFRPIWRHANRRLSMDLWGGGRAIWTADVEDRPLEVANLQVERVPAPDHVAEGLELEESAPVWRRSRIFVVDGVPVQHAIAYLPADLADGTPIAEADTGPGGTYARLAEGGHAPARFREVLRSRPAAADEAERLAMAVGAPVVEITRWAVTSDGRTVEYQEMLLDASRYVLEYAFSA